MCERRRHGVRGEPRHGREPLALPPRAPDGITGGGHAGLLFDGTRIYTGFSDGRAVAIDPADGTPIWERDTGVDSEAADGANEAHRTIDVDDAVLVDGNLFVASYTAGLYALDPAGGGESAGASTTW
ncbi:MAG: PQQ-binding-like beta-propeller repeat protein [Polyangiales bacterium]